MEPERPIEKRLRDCANKRREEAGPPLELHPATRRMLQGEVARCAPKPGAEGGSFKFLAALRPRLAWVLCVLAIAAVGAALLLPSLSHSTKKAPLTLADREELRSLTPVAAKPPVPSAVPPPTRLPTSDMAKAGANADLAANRERVASVAESTARTPPGAMEKSSQGNNRATMVEGGASAAPATAVDGFVAADKTLGLRAPGQKGAAESPVSNSQRYVQAAPASSPAVAGTVTAALSAGTAPILASFQMEQNGSDIRIVDADGSVYSGSLQLAKEPPSPNPALAQTTDLDKNTAVQGIGQGAVQSHLFYRFQVSGTNRSLKQSVTFNGKLFATANAAASPAWTNGLTVHGNQLKTPVKLFQLPLENSRVNGTAVINNVEAIPINAVPAAP